MTQATIPPPHKRYHSYFVTTYRNILLYWLANLIIFPTFSTCVYIIVKDAQEWLQTISNFIFIFTQSDIFPTFTVRDIVPIFQFIILFVAAIPLLSLFFTPRYLRLGFKGREGVVFVCLALIVVICLQPRSFSIQPDTTDSFLKFSVGWLIFGLEYFLLLNTWRSRLVTFTSISAFLVISIIEILSLTNPKNPLPQLSSLINHGIIITYLLTTGFLAFIFCAVQINNEYIRHRWVPPINGISVFVAICLLLMSWHDSLSKPWAVAIAGLGLMFLAARPRNFISRQIAHLRMVTRPIRHDQLYSQSSPVIKSRHIFNLLVSQWLPRYVSINNRKLIYTLALIVGGIAIPFLFGPYDAPLELMALGVASASVLVSIYTIVWLGYNSSRFIVTEFEPKASNPELEAIAKLTTFALVDELQRISILLKLRQVENLSSSGEETNAYFVTSGFDQDFINEVQQSVNLDVPKAGKISLDSLLTLGLRLLARIHVKGQVQRRSNGSIQIWAELNYRNTQRAAVDLVILPENSYQEIDDIFIRPYAREMALKLFIELGQVSHLGSSWKTFAEFLNGLEATSRRNWWQAIDFYRLALQTEETRKGTFGIGHYHLGAALVYQGNWDEGLQHLRTAEIDGPTLPETHYMLAMVLLRKHWGELHEYPNKFKEIEQHLKSALALRGDFPEAHHLLGEAYYRRGELEDRENSRPNKIENSPPNGEEDNKKRPKWTSYFR